MIIGRRGSGANHGRRTVELDAPKIKWDSKDNCIVLSQSNLKDFTTSAWHNYDIRITLDEFRKMLDALSEDGSAFSPDSVRSALEPALRALVRLEHVVVGATFTKKPN